MVVDVVSQPEGEELVGGEEEMEEERGGWEEGGVRVGGGGGEGYSLPSHSWLLPWVLFRVPPGTVLGQRGEEDCGQ